MTDPEVATMKMATGRLPSRPSCPAPLLIHADGTFECHGPDCPGACNIFHSDRIVGSCASYAEIRTLHACLRCLTHLWGDSADMVSTCACRSAPRRSNGRGRTLADSRGDAARLGVNQGRRARELPRRQARPPRRPTLEVPGQRGRWVGACTAANSAKPARRGDGE